MHATGCPYNFMLGLLEFDLNTKSKTKASPKHLKKNQVLSQFWPGKVP